MKFPACLLCNSLVDFVFTAFMYVFPAFPAVTNPMALDWDTSCLEVGLDGKLTKSGRLCL